MSRSVCRLSDSCTGHGCWPPRPNVSGSTNVFVNNRAAHRSGDAWASHCGCPKRRPCHGSVLASGSGTVFVNNRRLGRIGDPVACGSVVASGSNNVYAGG